MVLKVYVTAVALAAAVVGTLAGTVTGAPHAAPPIAALVMMGLLLWLTEFLQVRDYNYRGHGSSLNLVEGVLAPLVVFASGAEAVLICAAAIAFAEAFRRVGLMKVIFNTGQWTLATASAYLVAHSVLGSHPSAVRDLAATTAAVLVMSALNQLALTFVLILAMNAAHERQTRARVVTRLRTLMVASGVSLVAGLTLVAFYRWIPELIGIGAVYVAGLDAAGRALANVRADGHRLRALHQATHTLSTSLEIMSAAPACLRAIIDGFEVNAAELVLFRGTGATTYRSTWANGVISTNVATTPARSELVELLADVAEPMRLPVADDDDFALALRRAGHERVLVAPLRSDNRTIGVLLLFDRIGMEGFEAGELTIAAALGRELVGFVERVELIRAIEEERRKLADILESTSDGILTIDSDGVVTSWNNGLADMTGYGADEIVGTRHIGLLRARDGNGRDVLIERWVALSETSPLPTELQVVAAGGQALWLSCSYSRIPSSEGRREVLVVVARNITKARELERLKDDFVAVVSHELRTPLVPIKGWAQTLINRGDRLSDDQRRTAVQSILAQAQKLESLVLNILEASRVESGRADAEGVADVFAVTMRIVEDTLAARPDRVVRVRPPAVPSQVRGSAVWVERAVSNLIANAVKYSPDDEPVDVAISVEGDDVVVAVTDRGSGIAVDSQDRIFERFERLEETHKQTGTGLGLYITRRLARAMGGDVSVSSVPGAGSTFLLRLPVAPVAPGASVAPVAPARVPGQRLIDGDNVVNLR